MPTGGPAPEIGTPGTTAGRYPKKARTVLLCARLTVHQGEIFAPGGFGRKP